MLSADLSLVLGWQILARVYMARSDVGYTVRAAALHVWKTVVTNTPRTLAEVLPALMANIIASLAAPGALHTLFLGLQERRMWCV